ncbi:MAG: DUF1800 domain-containing protein [Rivularia sp. (in: Bacteria)]|nr:DUF1800 domain-containing protein [Rivularia sp. MS3]
MKVNLKSWILTVFISTSLLNSSCETISAQQLTTENIVIPQVKTQVQNSQVQDSKILHTINRLSFGAAPGDVEKVREIGIDKYIQQQLTPESIPQPQSLKNKLSQLQTLKLTPAQLYSQYSVGALTKPTSETRKKRRKKRRLISQQAVKARLLRSSQSPRQLQEVMVDFWYNHFNVYQNKGLTRLWMSAYEEQAIRPHVLGKFRDLLGATARHPAMLFYLDNWQNTAPNNRPKGRFKGLNENYARELMELHTLGVDGGYTQEDVIALAKIFTGWGFHNQPRKVENGYNFYFNSKRHDFSDKVFLGKQIKGSGIAEGEQALDILAKHPATARHISYKLAQYFVADEPPKTLIEKLSKSYLATDGDIRAVLKTLFQSSEFWDRKYYNAKFKTPYQYVISSIRATDTPINHFSRINSILHRMAMPLYGNQSPDGYKNTQQAWLSPNGINWRLSFANTIGRGGLKNRNRNKNNNNNPNKPRRPNKSIDSVELANTLGNNFSAKTKEVLNETPSKQRAVIILGSPEFMYR